ncbi:MAG: diaminopimelate decarboxylase [Cytophagales bacterium]|nr:diaminopimelate decarboxylase [Bernardetiaceae bacterium]MDW8209783.1 diaminopimelate decarboxylase [Cytophagales bacterium]
MFTSQHYRRFAQLETPFYYYDLALLEKTLQVADLYASKYGFHIHYALKANANFEILQPIVKAGFGADCVSGNEVKRAVEAGFPPEKIVFAGVGKSDREILIGLSENIFCFNVESIEELQVIDALAAQVGTTARLALRVNPLVEVNTHQYITTGTAENKFGIPPRDFDSLLALLPKLSHLQIVGLHMHIGSQICQMNNFRDACQKFNEIRRWFEQHGLHFAHLNVGGGLGVDYHHPDQNPIADFENYFDTFNRYLERQPGQQVHFELGRALVAQCGSLITRVLYVKQGQTKHFAIVDAGMTELIRPALYQAYHKIELLDPFHGNRSLQTYDIVGPVCESSDFLGKAITLPQLQRGDLLAIRTAGAYGQVMASAYNLRDKVPAIYENQP